MAGGNGVDLTGPLAGMWRDVYRKAGEVAEGRTTEQLKSHVYVYHPNGAGGGGGGDGPFVDEVGDTMTGALIMRLPGPYDAGAQHAYGAATPAFTPTLGSSGNYELGLRFRHPDGGDLVALRWFRASATATAPPGLKLWDSTATAAPVWTAPGAELEPFLDPAVGWKVAVFATPPALVAGRDYVVSYAITAYDELWRAEGYTPVPDAPLVVVKSVASPVPDSYPGDNPPSNAYLLDPVVGQVVERPPAAHTGAIRLQNGDGGVIAWRNAANTGDHTLTVDASDQLVFDGVPLGAGGGTGNTTMFTQTGTPTGATNSLWFNPSESA